MVHLNEQIQNNKVFIILTNIKHDVVEGQNDWKLSTQPSFSLNILVFWANKFCKNLVKNKIDFLFVCLFIYLDEANTSLSIIHTEIDCKRNLLEPCDQKDFKDTFFYNVMSERSKHYFEIWKIQHNKAKSEGQILHFLRKYSSNVRKFYIL